jgi:hypothetical protein
MVTPTCTLCGEYKRTDDMHTKSSVTFSDKEKLLFATENSEGTMCKSCFNILSYLQMDRILVSRSCKPMSAYHNVYYILIFIYNFF